MPILQIDGAEDLKIGQKITISDGRTLEVFDISGKNILVGRPGEHPREFSFIPLNLTKEKQKNYRPKTYVRLKKGNQYCLFRIDGVFNDGIKVSRKIKL